MRKCRPFSRKKQTGAGGGGGGRGGRAGGIRRFSRTERAGAGGTEGNDDDVSLTKPQYDLGKVLALSVTRAGYSRTGYWQAESQSSGAIH